MSRAAPNRPYHSPLRAEQVDQTRERLLDRMAEILADPEVRELTIAELARRSGVSLRTAYRYFPTKDDLYDAFNDWWVRHVPRYRLPESAEELPELTEKLFVNFAERENLVRAGRFSKPLLEVRARRKPIQVGNMVKVFAPLLGERDAREARMLAAAIHCMGGSDAWLNMRDNWGLTPEEAGRAARWALETLIEGLRREGAEKSGGSAQGRKKPRKGA